MFGFSWLTWMLVGLVLAHGVGVLSAIHALWHVRTSQGAIAWCLTLLMLPVFAVPFYWILGRSTFYEYRDQIRRVWRRRDGFAADFRRSQEAHQSQAMDRGPELSALKQLSGQCFTRGNRAKLLIDGRQTFDTMLRTISEARDYILFQSYILRDDEIGRRVQAKLIERARAGVRVYLLYDALGSYFLQRHYLTELKEAGVEVSCFAAMRRWRYPFQLNFRNHRKIAVIDGRVAYCGGHNVGDEYLGRDRRLSPWRDAHLEVRGPAVQAIQMSFVNDWHWAQRELIEGLRWEPPRAFDDGYDMLVLPCGPTDLREACTIFFVNAINMARKRLWMATPYFVPDPSIVNALAMAVLRGVEVRILIPTKSDSLLVHLATFDFLQPMEEIGVKIYRYDGFLHAKAFVVDDDVAYIGTSNLDNRSLRLNFELNMLVVDQRFAAEVAEMLRDDLARSRLTGPDDLAKRWFGFRLGAAAARLCEPIL